MIVVTGATGMLGGRVTKHLAEHGVAVRAMVRNSERMEALRSRGVESVVADMCRPETLDEALRGADTVFLVSPMDALLQVREQNVLEAAQRTGVRRIVKVYGAVQHPGELPGSLHNASVEAIRSSGLEWALLSPTSVLETSLLPMTRWIEHFGAMVASAGEGKVALVAADDVARAGAVILAERDENERDYVITGPELLTLGEISEIMSRVTGRSIPYTDVSDDELAGLQDEPSAGRTAQNPEIAMFFRAWRNGGGEARTDTFHELTGRAVTTTEEWIIAHCELFVAARDRAV